MKKFELKQLIKEELQKEIHLSPSRDGMQIFVVISPIDGLLIDYSFNTSPENQAVLRQKYVTNEEDEQFCKVLTLKELLSNQLKSSYNEIRY
jgi:hypothetical protein